MGGGGGKEEARREPKSKKKKARPYSRSLGEGTGALGERTGSKRKGGGEGEKE